MGNVQEALAALENARREVEEAMRMAHATVNRIGTAAGALAAANKGESQLLSTQVVKLSTLAETLSQQIAFADDVSKNIFDFMQRMRASG